MDTTLEVVQGIDDAEQVIVHFDLDCFFVQVERKRFPRLMGKPMVVHQHKDIISASYEARALGVKKHMTIEEAKAIVPTLEVVSIYKEYGSKVSYKPYQECSEQVENVIIRHGAPVVERGSIDEFYFDITELVSKRMDPYQTSTNNSSGTFSTPNDSMLSAQSMKSQTSSQNENTSQWHGIVYGGALDQDPTRIVDLCVKTNKLSTIVPKIAYQCDERMRVAAAIVHEIRTAIMKEVQITCSAGIAKNKLLARIASNLNKPNQQTIILRRGVETLLSHLPIEKLPKIGNKIGKEKIEEIKRLELVNCLDLQKYSLQEMKTMFSETGGRWLYDACRGDDFEEVLKKGPAKKIMRSMTLTPISNNDVELRQDFSYLTKELCDCLAKDKKENNRKPKTFYLHYRCVNEKEKCVSVPMTKITQHPSSKGFNPDQGQYRFEAFLQLTMKLFHESMGDKGWTMRWIGIAVGNFAEDPKPVSPKATIMGYFTKLPSPPKNNNNSTPLNNNNNASQSPTDNSLKRKLDGSEEKHDGELNKKQKTN